MYGNGWIKSLKLEMNAGGNPFIVHAAIVGDERDVVLVDTGITGQLELIKEALERESVAFDCLTTIIITHQDRDHIGSLPELLEAADGRLQVVAHEAAVPYIQGEVPLIKSKTLASPAKVNIVVQDGDMLPYGGGLQVIYTPGHTPDHISLYHPLSRTLISGDALTSQNGVLMPPSPQFTPDMEEALKSVSKLLAYDIDTVITYHGGVCTEGIKERLSAIAAGH